jgi:hypothetical protein
VIPWGVWEFRKRTGVEITAQQTAAFLSAADTVKGLIQTKLDQGKLTVAEIVPDNPVVAKLAGEALARIPDAAAGIKSGAVALATIAVSQVDTAPPVPAGAAIGAAVAAG